MDILTDWLFVQFTASNMFNIGRCGPWNQHDVVEYLVGYFNNSQLIQSSMGITGSPQTVWLIDTQQQ